MRFRRCGDAGQAFPIYITVVGGLLFLAFAYFAVGQAAANRNGAQTAADAAALAAAQETRDDLAGLWVKNVLDPAKWQGILTGDEAVLNGCWRAYQLASQNDAHMDGPTPCQPSLSPLSYTVYVEADKPVGESIVPGTENRHAHAHAKAVIEPLCTFEPPAQGAGDDVLPRLSCKGGGDWELDPKHLTDLPGPEDLFDVHLAD
ncbi:pilus assembly protein TadG-related protein [Streptomyces sp. NBC_00588]|uniref:pilus assembly protein TadG-related protein n=1 Tax=Streptomyces sp. NBC_00588 TaxID=2975784 RepID=UPI002E7FD80C|nr:pilus assembly protein TadG-related protein [Streptomyces sp. NBC_00588]WUB36188.1 pilus assembly protein TadG-related protein [Streptomyces sp. NBC_00588]